MGFADMFRSVFLEPLQQVLDSLPGTTIIIVPSVRDIMSDHAVYPQAKFDTSVIDDPVCFLFRALYSG